MATRARHIIGFTLIEMLIVIAIIASLAAISIPFIAKWGALASNDVVSTARDLQEMIRASQIYASANNTEAGVAYSLSPRNDSLSGNQGIKVISGMAMIRKLKPDELATLRYGRNEVRFVPVKNKDGAFREFIGNSCLSLMVPRSASLPNFIEPIDVSAQNAGKYLAYTNMGLQQITLYDVDGARVDPVYGFPENNVADFPAHIFEPTGTLDVADDVSKQRFQLWVTAYPDANENERYVQYAESEGVAIPYAKTLELYRTLGRVKLQL